jgi:hypothetical protein
MVWLPPPAMLLVSLSQRHVNQVSPPMFFFATKAAIIEQSFGELYKKRAQEMEKQSQVVRQGKKKLIIGNTHEIVPVPPPLLTNCARTVRLV